MITTANFSKVMACAVACTVMIGNGNAADETVATTSTVYRVVDGGVVFPGYDDAMTSSAKETTGIVISASDFPDAKVYRDQVLLVGDPVLSKPVDISNNATTLSITGRSRPAANIFPRLRVSLVTADNNRHRIFEGYWQSITVTTYEWPVSQWAKGGKARLEIELLNPGVSEEQRTWYYDEAKIR